MATTAEITLLLRSLFPHDALIKSPEMMSLVAEVVQTPHLAAANDKIFEHGPETPAAPAEALQQIPQHVIDDAIAGALNSFPEVYEHLLEIYGLIAAKPAVFEAIFGRRLTDGDEECPYWGNYHQPPVQFR